NRFISSRSSNNKLTARSQTSKKWRHGFTICSRSEDYSRTAEGLKCGNRILGIAVNVMMCPELLSETFLSRSAGNRRDLKAHAPRKLNSEMPKPTHSLNGYELAGS